MIRQPSRAALPHHNKQTAESRFELMRRRGEGFPLYWDLPPRAARYFFIRLLAVIMVACCVVVNGESFQRL